MTESWSEWTGSRSSCPPTAAACNKQSVNDTSAGLQLHLCLPGVDLSEGGPLVGQLVPALHHEGVHAAGAVLGAGQQLPRADHLNHLLVAVAVVGLKKYRVNIKLDKSRANVGSVLEYCFDKFSQTETNKIRPAAAALHSSADCRVIFHTGFLCSLSAGFAF